MELNTGGVNRKTRRGVVFMGNLAVINIFGLASSAYEPVFSGKSAFERVMEWAAVIPDASGIVLLAGLKTEIPNVGNQDLPVTVIKKESWDEEILIRALAETTGTAVGGDELPEALFYTWGDAPLPDKKLTRTLWDLHYKYDAEYTFADGYPVGMAPEILSRSLPEKLIPLAVGRNGEVRRDTLFEVLRQDINAFDVETHLSPEDMRMDRVSITCDTRRNIQIAEALYKAGGRDADSLCAIIPENKKSLRSLPSYFPIQVTDHHPQNSSYSAYNTWKGDPRENSRFMDPNVFSDLCRRIVDFAGDAVIVPSLWGEPASHPSIGEIIKSALDAGEGVDLPDAPAATKVLVETSGIGWNPALLEELASGTEAGRLLWIITLDAADPDLYKALRGDGLAEAEETARTLAGLFGKNCWVQAVRMLENEEHLEDFHKKWTDEGVGVIIQKYDSYAGYLPEKQPADLSPLHRFPCWHLKRDMPVLVDGTVPVCIDALDRLERLGNAFTEDLERIWSAGEQLHERHVAGEYPNPCAQCDEYYTFNF